MSQVIVGIRIPDSGLAQEVDELVRDVGSDLLFHHARRVFLFAALSGQRRDLTADPEILYVAALFHDLGLLWPSTLERPEIDGANTAADFMRSRHLSERDVEDVWDAIALHTTPSIARHKRPVVSLVSTGVEIDALGGEGRFLTPKQCEEVCACCPRESTGARGQPTVLACGTVWLPGTPVVRSPVPFGALGAIARPADRRARPCPSGRPELSLVPKPDVARHWTSWP